MPFIPHTQADVEAMLASIGVTTTEELFDEIPSSLRYAQLNEVIPEGRNEMTLRQEANSLANKNTHGICFIGAGSYEHHIPAAVWDVASRGEFLTAYTPYQAEASQGTLQLLYEFQTMIAELTGMEVANASLYDGATALAEAILMAVRCNKISKTNRVLIVGTLHPFYRETVETIARNQHIEIITLPFNAQTGITSLDALKAYSNVDITALVMVQPNFFGCLEEVDALSNWAYERRIIRIASVNPVSLALLKPPGQWGSHGVDIVCGEGQPLGVPLASGGPYFGFFSTRLEHVRQMPGRLIGRTLDKDKKIGFTLTLQAREQHIRRGKATSNICTNQGLLVTAATIHMSLLGPEGLLAVAQQCHQNTAYLMAGLEQISGVKRVFTSPCFHESLVHFDDDVSQVLAELHKEGINGGYPIEFHYPEFKNCLLICATEMRTKQEMDHYIQVIKKVMSRGNQ